jgi:hypothetical protein
MLANRKHFICSISSVLALSWRRPPLRIFRRAAPVPRPTNTAKRAPNMPMHRPRARTRLSDFHLHYGAAHCNAGSTLRQ